MCLYIISLVVYSGLKMNSAVVLSLTAIMLFVHGTFVSIENTYLLISVLFNTYTLLLLLSILSKKRSRLENFEGVKSFFH